MAWSNPRTWVAGEQVTASIMNTYVRDEFTYLKDSPDFDGSIDVAGSITAGSGNVGIVGSDGRIPAINATYFASLAGITVVQTCTGRLTLTTALPVTTADVTAATTLYFALYGGNQIGLYTGTTWALQTITELSIAVPGTTNTMYDVFVQYNAGTPQLSVTAWTNDTTRATALTLQDGALVLSGALTSRYVGSFRTTGVSGQTEDSMVKRYVWNYYNRVNRPLRKLEATNTWDYTLAAFQQANASAANQLDLVCGVAEDMLDVQVAAQCTNTNAGVNTIVAIGEDSATVPSTSCLRSTQRNPGAGDQLSHRALLRLIPAIGRHYYSWLEYSAATGLTTWYGDDGATLMQSGIQGLWRA